MRDRKLSPAIITTSEIKLGKLLAAKFPDVRFRTQVEMHGFVLDFFLPKYNLAIEVDGKYHDHQKTYDGYRNRMLHDYGVKTLRIPNRDVWSYPDYVVGKIKAAIDDSPDLRLEKLQDRKLPTGKPVNKDVTVIRRCRRSSR